MNREYAFYIPECDSIVIQIIYDKSSIHFEWDWHDLAKAYIMHIMSPETGDGDPLEYYHIIPLGEV